MFVVQIRIQRFFFRIELVTLRWRPESRWEMEIKKIVGSIMLLGAWVIVIAVGISTGMANGAGSGKEKPRHAREVGSIELDDITSPNLIPDQVMGVASPAARQPVDPNKSKLSDIQSFSSVVREEHKIMVHGVEERWRLEWKVRPNQACSPDQPEWMTCPCNGFAFGERGDLVLVRERPGNKEERLGLTRLFQGDFDGPGYSGEAVLRRWDVEKEDVNESDSAVLASRVRVRPIATVMRFGDYDHDGEPTEFLLQVGTLPCGKQVSVAVGVSHRNDQLHAFSTVEHPGRPLVLQTSYWESLLRAKAPFKVVDWVCGDHASETETVLELSADTDGIHAMRSEYECDGNEKRAKLINKDSL
jgi:hypothetical protein